MHNQYGSVFIILLPTQSKNLYNAGGIISILLITITVSTFGVITHANSAQEFDPVKAKQELVDKYKDNFMLLSLEGSNQRAEIIDKEILEMTALGKNAQELDEALAKYNVYRLIRPEVKTVVPMSQGSQVTLSSANIYYDSGANEWVVVGGGYWNDDMAWKNDAPLWVQALCPASHNLGGEETVGVSLHNTNGQYGTTSMVSAMGYYSDGQGWSNYIQNASNNNYEQGISFKYQDVITDPNPGDTDWSDWRYRGRHFSALARYSASFTNYSGNANTFYGHTWSGGIATLTLGTSGVSITFSDSNKSWPAYDEDVPF